MTDAAGLGTAALPDGGRVDFARLRQDRRQRLLDAMAASNVEALVLGRPANVLFASGARQLWTSGPRPFAAACVVVGGTGRVHLLATWDEGVPAEISRKDLFGLSWNPDLATDRLRAVPGLDRSQLVATDGWGPGAAGLMSLLCPDAEVADAGPLLRRARTAKSPDEVACIVTAAAAAEAALTAMAGALRPGITERDLVAVYASTVAGLGMPCPPTEGVAWVASGSGRLRRVASDRPLAAGDLVALNPGALYAGYEASVGRTRRVPDRGGEPPLDPPGSALLRNRAVLDAVIGACRPGATGADLMAAWRSNGGGPLYEPLAWGVGLGVEGPVVGEGLGAGAAIRAGAVLAVQAWTVDEETGGVFDQDMVLVGPEGPTLLTRARSAL